MNLILFQKELELRQEAEQKVSLMQQSITRLELETEQKRGKLVKLQEEVNALNFRILSSRSEGIHRMYLFTDHIFSWK